MPHLRVVPIVEGHGEVECIRILLERLWYEELGGGALEVLAPIRKNQSDLVTENGLAKAVRIALEKLRGEGETSDSEPAWILILLDGDGECPAKLGPQLVGWARAVDERINVTCVVVNLEYETWFVAAAESLVTKGHLLLRPGERVPSDPEGQNLRKKWVEDRFVPRNKREHASPQSTKAGQYNPTQDQAAMTRVMDLRKCRERSPSFARFWREVQKCFDQQVREVGG